MAKNLTTIGRKEQYIIPKHSKTGVIRLAQIDYVRPSLSRLIATSSSFTANSVS